MNQPRSEEVGNGDPRKRARSSPYQVDIKPNRTITSDEERDLEEKKVVQEFSSFPVLLWNPLIHILRDLAPTTATTGGNRTPGEESR